MAFIGNGTQRRSREFAGTPKREHLVSNVLAVSDKHALSVDRLKVAELWGDIRPGVNAGFIEQSLSECDRRACKEGKIEGVAWSAVEFINVTITIGNQAARGKCRRRLSARVARRRHADLLWLKTRC